MGLTKQYLSYEQSTVYGVLASSFSNAFLEQRSRNGPPCFALCASNEFLFRFNLRSSEKVGWYSPSNEASPSVITKLAVIPSFGPLFAAGYKTGNVCIFKRADLSLVCPLNGHKSQITALQFSIDGSLLASGARDCDIVLWDVLSETGLYRLRGHKDIITQLHFLEATDVLISSSKDSFIKFWNLTSQFCFRTLVGHRTEVWDFAVIGSAASPMLITGAADSELRLWQIEHRNEDDRTRRLRTRDNEEPPTESVKQMKLTEDLGVDEEHRANDESVLSVKKIGAVRRMGKGRLVSLSVAAILPTESSSSRFADDSTDDRRAWVLVCHGTDSTLEVFRFSSEAERSKRLQKKAKKLRKRKLAASEGDQVVDADDADVHADAELGIDDYVAAAGSMRLDAKPSSVFALPHARSTGVDVLTVLKNNSLALHTISFDAQSHAASFSPSPWPLAASAGHRSDVRALSFSSDGSALLSASGTELKVWNRSSDQCVRTLPCGYALCCAFIPGDRHVIIGTKSGALQMFDLSTARMVFETQAHEGELWSLCLRPDRKGFVTGGADKVLRFWEFRFEAVAPAAHISNDDVAMPSRSRSGDDSEDGGRADGGGKSRKRQSRRKSDSEPDVAPSASVERELRFASVRSMQMPETIVAVRYSPDSRLIAVSLLDSTVKILFEDSLKFFLSLYGHKLPALCMDISSDSQLIATGSADRNIKLWGLDFGDCHKSIFAHDDSVSCVLFQPRTHLLFTAGKDGVIRYWDGDRFEKILEITTHHAEIWALAISEDGKQLASASHDDSVRVFVRTDEPIVLSEQKELEREKEDEQRVEEPVIVGEANPEVGLAGRASGETVSSADRILEAIDVMESELERVRQWKADCAAAKKQVPEPPRHPMMVALNCTEPEEYFVSQLRRVRASELDSALLFLPFAAVVKTLRALRVAIERGWHLELACRCALFLIRIHHGQITHSQRILDIIDDLRASASRETARVKDLMGYNVAVLKMLQGACERKDSVTSFTSAVAKRKKKQKQRTKEVLVIRS